MLGNQGIEQAGARVFEDISFAQRILEGKEEYPEIRTAILEDLAEAHHKDIEGLVKTMDPAQNPQVLKEYVENGPKPGGMHVQHLIDRAQCW